MKTMKELYQQMLDLNPNDHVVREQIVSEILPFQKADGSFGNVDSSACEIDKLVEEVYFPTYYATASLMYALQLGTNETALREALAKGLSKVTGRRLIGQGYDATAQKIQALNIYKNASLYAFIQQEEKDYKDFCKMIRMLIEDFRVSLAMGRTVYDWSVDFKEQFENEVSDYDLHMTANVWYAAYGPDMNEAKFMECVNTLTDTSAPIQSKAITIPYNMYFAAECSDNSEESVEEQDARAGYAFLDDSQPGMTLGRMYLMTSAQFVELQNSQPQMYNKKIQIGREDWVPIYAFTSPDMKKDSCVPSPEYRETIMKGLKETYPTYSDTTRLAYLLDSGIVEEDDRSILNFIRNHEPKADLLRMAENTVGINRAQASIQKLLHLHMIEQTSGREAGSFSPTDYDATFGIKSDMADVVAMLLIMNRKEKCNIKY